MSQKFLFIDRDGTIIAEPPTDYQVDRLDKLALEPDVIPALLALQKADYKLVMITNQDGLGTSSFPQETFDPPHNLMMQILTSQGINFEQILICPHLPEDNCTCRKPKTALVENYLADGVMNSTNSYVIGDRETDLQLAENMGISGLRYQRDGLNWTQIAKQLTQRDRHAYVNRVTKETAIDVNVWLDREGEAKLKPAWASSTICWIKSPPTAVSAWIFRSAAICISMITTRWKIPRWRWAKRSTSHWVTNGVLAALALYCQWMSAWHAVPWIFLVARIWNTKLNLTTSVSAI